MHEAKQRHITPKEAAAQRGVTERWVRKLWARMRKEGDRAVIHRLRGRSSKRKIPEPVRERAGGLVQREYRDFGPPLGSESLAERRRRRVSRETLPGGMIRAQGWKPRRARIERFFQTAQDRLGKGLRQAGVNTLQGAPQYGEPVYLPLWKRRFTVAAAHPTDAHRPLGPEYDWAALGSQVESRGVAADYTVPVERRRYQMAREAVRAGWRGARLRLEQRWDGSVAVRFREHCLPVRECGTPSRQPLGERPKLQRAAPKARPPAGETGPHRWMEGFDRRRSKTLWAVLREEQAGPPAARRGR